MSTYKMLPAVETTIDTLTSEFNQIPDERKSAISQLKMYIAQKKRKEKKYC